MNYYIVKAKCGHVGKGMYYEVDFPILANSKKEAAQICLKKGKVKKQLKNAITSVNEVDYEEFIATKKEFNKNDYVKAHTSREIVDYYRLAKPLVFEKRHYKKSFDSRKDRVSFLLKKQRIMEECHYA